MSDNPFEFKVSVVTPAYNAVATLPQCVESIRAQAFCDWEHIIVDDGSTDNTWALLQSLAEEDTRLRIMQQANAGQGKARNVAIEAARGEYIALLDADDWSLPDRLALQSDFLDTHPRVDVLGGAIINISETGEELGVSRLAAVHDVLAAEIYQRTPFYTSTVMARREFFGILGGFRDFRRVEDIDLWLRGYQEFRYHNLDVPLSYYRRSQGINWPHAFRSAKVRLAGVKRDKKPWYYAWYAFRPLIATLLNQLGLKR
jgi:glycosyltransferase involved in cell wall biosynthesis